MRGGRLEVGGRRDGDGDEGGEGEGGALKDLRTIRRGALVRGSVFDR